MPSMLQDVVGAMRAATERRFSGRARNHAQTLVRLPWLLGIRNTSRSIADSVLVTGPARSGTTWLAEAMAESLQARLVFEPLHSQTSQFPSCPDPLIVGAERGDASFAQLCRRVLLADLRPNYAVDRGSRPGRYRRRVVKDLALGWALPYLRSAFPELTILYILRNPWDTLASFRRQPRVGSLTRPRQRFAVLLADPTLRATLWDRVPPSCIDADNLLDLNFAIWACQQRLVLEQLRADDGIHLVSYEQLLLQSEPTAAALRDLLRDRGLPATSLSLAQLRTPSRTTTPGEHRAVRAGAQLGKWLGSFTQRERARLEELLERFGLDDLFDAKGQPRSALLDQCVGGGRTVR